MKIKNIPPLLLVLAALMVGYLMISPAVQAASNPGEDSKEISQLLSDAKIEAHQLELAAVTMESFTRSPLSRQSHATQLNTIKHHINKSGEILTKLQNARAEGSPWQQKAIDEIAPLLKELADNTTAAMNHFNEDNTPMNMSATYKEYLKSNREMSKELAALIADYVDYGSHKALFERIGEKVVASER